MSADLHRTAELSNVSLQDEFMRPLPIYCHEQGTSSESNPTDLTGAQICDIQKKVHVYSFTKKTSLDLPLKRDCLRENVVLLDEQNSSVEGEQQVSLTRPTSLPGMLQPSQCHCSACCSCSPQQQNCFIPSLSLSRTTQFLSASLDAGMCYNSGGIHIRSFVTPESSSKTMALDVQDRTPDSNKDNISHSINESVSELDQELGHLTSSVDSNECTVFEELPVASPTQSAMTEGSLSNGDSIFSELNSLSSQCQLVLAATGGLPTAAARPKPERYQKRATQSVSSLIIPSEFKQRLQSIKSWFREFSDTQKNLILISLLEECNPSQKHLLSMQLEFFSHRECHPNCRDLLGWLPEPAALHIFSYLDPVSLCRASCVSHRWLSIANDNSLWRQLSSLPKWRLSRVGEQKQFLTFRMPDGSVNWKELFAERFRLQNNWIKGRCNIRTFEGHTQGVSCVQFDENRIVSGSSDKTIKLWNIRTNSQWAVQTLVGHSGTVRCLHLDGNRLVSGSTDRTIKVWDLSSQESWTSIACKVTMVGHIDTVRCLKVDADKVISGSYDKTLKVWDIKTGECRRTLSGHEAAVLCVQFDSTKIISGSCDKTIKVWTFEGSCVMTLQGHQDAVTCLQFDEWRIISGSLDCTLRFWNVQNGHLINTIDWKAAEGHTRVVRCLQADSWRVVSASDDKTIKVWSLDTGQRLVTLRNHTDGVTCLQFSDSVLVSGSYDKTVKLWDFSCC